MTSLPGGPRLRGKTLRKTPKPQNPKTPQLNIVQLNYEIHSNLKCNYIINFLMESKSKKSFVVSTAESRYIKPLLQSLIEENHKNGWKETLSKEKFDLKWVPSSVEDEECKFHVLIKGN